MPLPQAVLFDFGQVLTLPPDPAVWTRILSLTGLSEDELHRRYWAHRDDYDAGLLTGDQYWQAIADAPSPDLLRALKAADVDLWTRMNPDMMAWVERLHAAGVRTGILSNMPDAMAEGICGRFDWIGNFDHATWSHALKMRKPQPAIYAHATAGLGIPAEHILFIDDKVENTDAAIASGMQAIVYRQQQEFVRDMEQRGWSALLHPAQTAVSAV